MKYAVLAISHDHELSVLHVVQNENCGLIRRSNILGYRCTTTQLTKGLSAGPIIPGWYIYPERNDAWKAVENHLSSCYVDEYEILFVRSDK